MRNRRKFGRVIRGALGWLAAAAALPACAAGAGQDAAAGPSCELHVWGAGRPNLHSKVLDRLMKQADPAQLDRANPLSNVNVFSTVNRASGLDDAALEKLFPHAGRVSIVRHADVVDLDRVPLAKLGTPLTPGASGCYADLVIVNLYAIFPNPNAPWQYGLVGNTVAALMAGGDRLVIDFWFRDFTAPDGKLRLYKRKNDSPLPHVPFLTAAMKEAVEASAKLNFENFSAFVAQKRGG